MELVVLSKLNKILICEIDFIVTKASLTIFAVTKRISSA
jgi:hypothetical protein